VYFLTFQVSSPRLTYEMLSSVQIPVDEIVTTRDSTGALSYAFIHLLRRVTEQELDRAVKTLETSHGVKESNIFGYDAIASSSLNLSELIEDHPGFQILLQHEMNKNRDFCRWTADGFSGINCGYNLLKTRLLAKREAHASSGVGASSFGSRAAAGGRGSTTSDEEEEEPCTRTDGGGKKRRKTGENKIGGGVGGPSMVPFDVVMDKMWEGARNSLQIEQQRRERAEQDANDLRVQLSEQRRNIKKEMKEKNRKMKEELFGLRQSMVVLFNSSVCQTLSLS